MATLNIEMEKDLKLAFEHVCMKNKVTPKEIIISYCQKYVESGGITDEEVRKSKRLNGIPT